MPGFLSGGLTVLIRGETSMLSASIKKMFQLCMSIWRFYLGESPEAAYKVTVSKGDGWKHAKSMPNVSGIFSLPAEFVN